MERFSAFDDAALLHRIDRLERAEHDLQQEMMVRISRADAEGQWARSDAQYEHLSSVLKKVRDDLLDTENEFLRRGTHGLELAEQCTTPMKASRLLSEEQQ